MMNISGKTYIEIETKGAVKAWGECWGTMRVERDILQHLGNEYCCYLITRVQKEPSKDFCRFQRNISMLTP